MFEFLGGIFASIFGTHSAIATVIISMFPLIELKGGIPVGMSTDFWGNYALNGTQAFLYALLGSCLVVPILALIFTPIINWLKKTKLFKKLGHVIDQKVKTHSANINSKISDEKSKTKKTWIKCVLLFAFVAVPLPLTGVWTGTCVGVAIGLKFWQNVVSVVLGNIVAGLIIVFVCSVFPEFTTILFVIVLVLIIIMLTVGVIKFVISSKKSKINEANNNLNENQKESKSLSEQNNYVQSKNKDVQKVSENNLNK